jgi:hypothetical protein
MPKQRRVKKPDSAPPTTAHVLPMELQIGDRLTDETDEWEVVSRPYTSNAGKNAGVHVKKVGQPDVIEIRIWRAHERVSVKRTDSRGGQTMMRLGRRASLLVALSLLTSAATAYAECAWMLWNDDTFLVGAEVSQSLLLLLGAWPTFQQCEQTRIAKAKDLLRMIARETPGPNVDRVVGEENGDIVVRRTHLKDGRMMSNLYRLICLPDTVDPRGAKGK